MKPPKFVRLGITAMRLVGNEYYRDAGRWSIGFKEVDGNYYSKSDTSLTKHLNNVLLIEITEEEWKHENFGKPDLNGAKSHIE